MIYFGTLFVLLVSLYIGWKASKLSDKSPEDFVLAGRNLRAVQIGLSAGATGNSGFIVTAGVALGYIGGLSYCFLPLFWLLGELIFWKYFSVRLRQVTLECTDKSIIGLIGHGASQRFPAIILALVAGVGLVLYAASQVVVAQTLLSDGLGLDSITWPLVLLGIMETYVLIGGFRSTVWTDIFQAIVMLMLTLCSIVGFGVLSQQYDTTPLAWNNIAPFQGWPPLAVIAFAATWIAAGAGFGLSQPHVAERYIAAENESELKKAMWVYNGFLQFTWLGMTLVGVLLRAVHPGIGYDEGILVSSLNGGVNELIFGALIGAMLCAVISTVDSILHSTGSMFTTAVFGTHLRSVILLRGGSCFAAVLVGLLFLKREGTIFSLSSLAVVFLTASLAPAVLLRIFTKANSLVTFLSVLVGSLSYIFWYKSGVGEIYGEFFPRFELVPALFTTFIVILSLQLFMSLKDRKNITDKISSMD